MADLPGISMDNSVVLRRSLAQKERGSRPASLKLTRSIGSTDKYQSSPSKPVTVESCEQFFTDMILSRHARKLLMAFRLKDLGKFAAHLDFDLTAWFTKERYRAAYIDDFLEASIMVHRQFDWSYPSQTSGSQLSQSSRGSNKQSRRNSSRESESHLTTISSDITTPTTPSTNPEGQEEMVGEIRARLAAMNASDEHSSFGGTEISETSSVTHSIDDLDSTLDEPTWINEVPNLKAQEQKSRLGSKQCERELKYLLDIFVESRCLDWCIIISLMLDDAFAPVKVIDKMIQFKDVTKNRVEKLIEQISTLENWAEQECPSYISILNFTKTSIEELRLSLIDDEATLGVKTSQPEEKDFLKPEDKGATLDHESSHERNQETGNEETEEGNVEEPSECVLS